MKPLLSIRKLTKRFGPGCEQCVDESRWGEIDANACPNCGTVWALRGLDLDLFPGEIVGIVGESGADKTTLVDLLSLAAVPDYGAAHLANWRGGLHSIYSASDQEKRHLSNVHISTVYQDASRGLLMGISSGGNVVERLLASGERCIGDMRARAQYLLDYMELQGLMDVRTGRLSAGMKQRVQIAKALVHRPSVILFDEPTTGLDVSVQARTLDLIRKAQREHGFAALLVTHDWNVLRLLATRALVLKAGRVIERGTVEQLIEDPQAPYSQLLIHSSTT